MGTATIVIAGLIGVVSVLLVANRATSLGRQFRDEVSRLLRQTAETSVISERDLADLPEPVAHYIRNSGAVGRPRIQNFHARFHGEIRSGRDDAWMPFTGEQYNFYNEPARVFLMRAKRSGVPFRALHRYVSGAASMVVRAAGIFAVVNTRGPEMDQAETVTLFNDMCVFAPAALVHAPITWQVLSSDQVRGEFMNAGHRVSATLTFDEAGRLVDFVSDDRYRLDGHGRCERMRWSTPVGNYSQFGDYVISNGGEGWWLPARGAFPYIRFTIDAIEFNTGGHSGPAAHRALASLPLTSKAS
ncbi:MAG TPA: DUF6544 family protein [Gemmatimonadaceae bacterium]